MLLSCLVLWTNHWDSGIYLLTYIRAIKEHIKNKIIKSDKFNIIHVVVLRKIFKIFPFGIQYLQMARIAFWKF